MGIFVDVPDAVKRAYRSDARAAAARRTRSDIREAAGVLFVDNGYVATTVRQIADRAGVAVRTVFNAFPGGKAQLFDEILDHALGGDDDRIPLIDRPVARRPVEASDGSEALRLVAEGAADLYGRAGDLITTYLESAGADPHMRHHADLGATEAAKIMRRVARSLHQSQALREGLTPSRAGDIMLALCSPHVHHLLCRKQGWSGRAYRVWLTRELQRALLAES
jgi:AcrR family transcriptional regulator